MDLGIFAPNFVFLETSFSLFLKYSPSVAAIKPGLDLNTHACCQQVTSAAYDYFAKDQRPIILFDGVCNL